MRQIPVKSKLLPELKQISKISYTAGTMNLTEIPGLSTVSIEIKPLVEVPGGFKFRFGLSVDPSKTLILLGVTESDSGNPVVHILNAMKHSIKFKESDTVIYAELEEMLHMKVINNTSGGVVMLDQPKPKASKKPSRRSKKKS